MTAMENPVCGEAAARAAGLRIMGFDVDGVLTDGRLYFGAQGEALKAFHVRDGAGIKMLQAAGLQVALVTGRESGIVRARAADLGITLVRQGVTNKRAVFAQLLEGLGLSFAQAGFMGDDGIDLPLMQACAFCAAPLDAHPDVLKAALYIPSAPAGQGAVRDVCEWILRAQNRMTPALP
jgi:3-deoxy-D-manno-octulosonate 8-phosphate phosphatase (KDO 8-P phosphatase)